jgi:hypothetical protein
MKRLLTLTLLLLPLASEAPSREQQQARRRIAALKKAPTPAEAEAAKRNARATLLARRALQEQQQEQQQAKKKAQLPIGPAPKVAVHNQDSDSSSSDSDSDSGDNYVSPRAARKSQRSQTLMKKLTKAARPMTPILDTTVIEAQDLGRITNYHKRKSGLTLALRAVKEGHLPYFVTTNGTKWLSWYNQGAKEAVDTASTTSHATTQELIAAMSASQHSNFEAQQKVMTLLVNGEAASKASTEFEITEGRATHAAQTAAQVGRDAVNVLVAALQYAQQTAITHRQLVKAAKSSHPHPEELDAHFARYSNLDELMDFAQDQFEASELARRTARDEEIAAIEKKKAEAASELEKLATAAKEKEKAAATTTADATPAKTEDAK